MRRKIFILLSVSLLSTVLSAQELTFDPENFTEKQLTMPDGYVVKYKAYENIFYVRNIEDSVYQTLNIFVPEKLKENAPVFLRTYVSGYMASKAKLPSPKDASGRALEEGYVVCIPGSRGSNSFVHKDLYVSKKKRGKGKKKKHSGEFETVYTGKLPAGIVDLKAAVRFLKANDALIPGNSLKIIADGTSAGGAFTALLGATGNHPDYDGLLQKAGAAKAQDDIWTVVSYCPITDLEHSDMAYEWLYGFCNKTVRRLDAAQSALSDKLSALYPDYLNSLNLKDPATGEDITAENYLKYLKTCLLKSVHKAFDEGADIADTVGVFFYDESKESRCIVDLNLKEYLTYVAQNQKLKNPPAFDSQGNGSTPPSAENKAFGLSDGTTLNFTEFALHDNLSGDMKKRVKMTNPMNYLSDDEAVKAQHWYIRHGAKDRDTGFQTAINLALKLQNSGLDVNFFLPWDTAHTGDYRLNELFDWLETLQ